MSPEYFLDEMSVDEITVLLKVNNEKVKDQWERVRHQCFYTVVSQNGTKNIKKPSDLFLLPWDIAEKKQGKKLNKEQIDKKAKEAEQWLNNR